jgi:MFS family permease
MFFGSILFLVNVWEWSILKAGFAIAPGPAVAALLAPRFGKLAGQIGQRPLVVTGGSLFAIAGLYMGWSLTTEVSYLTDFVVPWALVAVSVPLVFPQVTSAAAQALPPNRVGVGGATTQAIRQFGASFGVAMTIALLGSLDAGGDLVGRFDRVWWFLVVGGVLTALLAVPLRTGSPVHSAKEEAP